MDSHHPILRAVDVEGRWTGRREDTANLDLTFTVYGMPRASIDLIGMIHSHAEIVGICEPCDPFTHGSRCGSTTSAKLLAAYPFELLFEQDKKVNHETQEQSREPETSRLDLHSEKTISSEWQHFGSNINGADITTSPKPPKRPFHAEDDADNPTMVSEEAFSPPMVAIERLSVSKRQKVAPRGFIDTVDTEKSDTPKRVRKPLPIPERPPWRSPGLVERVGRGRTKFGHPDGKERKISHSADARFQGKKTTQHNHKSNHTERKPLSTHSWDDALWGAPRTFTSEERKIRLQSFDTPVSQRSHSPSRSVIHAQEATDTDRFVELWLERGREEISLEQPESIHSQPSTRSIWKEDLVVMANQTQCMSDSDRERLEHQLSRNVEKLTLDSQDSFDMFQPLKGHLGHLNDIDSHKGVSDPHYASEGAQDLGKDKPFIIVDQGRARLQFMGAYPRDVSVHIKVKAHVAEHAEGGLILDIPGLPFQAGQLHGDIGWYGFTIVEDFMGIWHNRDKIKCIKENSVTEFQDGRTAGRFSPDRPLQLRFLLFEETRVLKDGQYELDWTLNTGEDATSGCTIVTATCSIRVTNFMFWSENVSFHVWICGGPTDTNIHAFLAPGSRRLQLPRCYTRQYHKLRIDISCPTTEISKPFVVTWEAQVPPRGLPYSVTSNISSINDLSSLSPESTQFGKDVHELRKPLKGLSGSGTALQPTTITQNKNVDILWDDASWYDIGEPLLDTGMNFYAESKNPPLHIKGPECSYIGKSPVNYDKAAKAIAEDRLGRGLALEPPDDSHGLRKSLSMVGKSKHPKEGEKIHRADEPGSITGVASARGDSQVVRLRNDHRQRWASLTTVLHDITTCAYQWVKKMIRAVNRACLLWAVVMIWAMWVTFSILEPEYSKAWSQGILESAVSRVQAFDYRVNSADWIPIMDVLDWYHKTVPVQEPHETLFVDNDFAQKPYALSTTGLCNAYEERQNDRIGGAPGTIAASSPAIGHLFDAEQADQEPWLGRLRDKIDTLLGWPGPLDERG